MNRHGRALRGCSKGDKDFAAMERSSSRRTTKHPLRILAYCLMGNHWHFVVWPAADGQMSGFFRWLTLTHAVRWRVAHRTVGWGHLYRGRFKSFPIQRDENLLEVLRYVERNALSAGLVRRAEDWRWSSLWARRHGSAELRAVLHPWPVRRPRRLDGVGERGDRAAGTGAAGAERASRPAVRRGPMGCDDGGKAGSGAHGPSRRPAEDRETDAEIGRKVNSVCLFSCTISRIVALHVLENAKKPPS